MRPQLDHAIARQQIFTSGLRECPTVVTILSHDGRCAPDERAPISWTLVRWLKRAGIVMMGVGCWVLAEVDAVLLLMFVGKRGSQSSSF